jgi:GH24 family phage-related lysozyme (muramidase)
MKYIIFLLLLTSCTISEFKKEEIKIVSDNKKFTTTQQYEILCWVIKKSENYRANVYKCQAGKKTVGWGFTNVKSVKNIHHADEIFRDIINPLYNEVNKQYPNLTYLQKAVITSLYYNTGSLNKIKQSDFSKALLKNDLKKAIKNFKSWNKVKVRKGKFIVSNGLVKRRSYESKLLDGSFSMNDYNKLKSEITKIYKQNLN